MSLACSILYCLVSGALPSGGNITFQTPNGSANRVQATTDQFGNRTAVTTNPPA